MPEPSFGGRRRYGILAAGAAGALALLLAVVPPALATGSVDAERDRRGPPRIDDSLIDAIQKAIGHS